MSFEVVFIWILVFGLIGYIRLKNDYVLSAVVSFLICISLSTIWLAAICWHHNVVNSETKEFKIESLYYNNDGYLTRLIDDNGTAYTISEAAGGDLREADIVSISKDDKISYIEKTQEFEIKFLFIHDYMKVTNSVTELPKNLYYDYKYGKHSKVVSAK